MLELCLCNRACVFRPFLLTVESQQLPGGARVCCSVMKAFLISGLGCGVHASQLETAEINTCCPVARSLAVTNLTQDPLRAAVGACWHQDFLNACFLYYVQLTFKKTIPSRWHYRRLERHTGVMWESGGKNWNKWRYAYFKHAHI